MPAKIRTRAILVKKQPFSESSVLMQVFSEALGTISILAKGIHRGRENKNLLLNVLNEYEFVISASLSGGIYTLNEMSSVEEYPTDLPLETWISAQAGLEIIVKMIIPEEDTPAFYHVLKNYLTYQKSVTKNSIAIFWRFLLHLYKLLGIPLEIDKCSVCQKDKIQPAGFSPVNGQVVCCNCFAAELTVHSFSPEVMNILTVLPVIGNYLQDLDMSREAICRINQFFLNYLSVQFHKNIHLKSLKFYKDNLKQFNGTVRN